MTYCTGGNTGNNGTLVTAARVERMYFLSLDSAALPQRWHLDDHNPIIPTPSSPPTAH